ncbi:hypothetical protein Tco_0502114, partial [Tanacetum coccineum]
MTTSVVNNSVFRGFFEKQKLTRPNFIDWYRQLRILLSVEDNLNYLEHPIPATPVPAQAGQQVAPKALAAHAAWNYNMHSMGKTINELHAMLKLHEQTLPKNNTPALHEIRVGKGLRGSRKLKPGTLSLYVDNGQRAAVEAIGSYHLSLPSRALVKRDTLTKPDKLETSKSLEDLEIIQEEDTHPSIDTSLNQEEDDQKFNEPQSDINPIRRYTKTHHPTDRMCLYIDAEEHELGDLGEPANYKAALLDSESDN